MWSLAKTAQVTVGIDVVNTISNIRADLCFMGTGGISVKQGVTEPDWEVAHIKKCMVDVSDYVVSMCVSPKLMEVKKFFVVPIKGIDAIITDLEPTEPIFDVYKETGLTVI